MHSFLFFLYIWHYEAEKHSLFSVFSFKEAATIVDTTINGIGLRALRLGGAVLKNYYGKVNRIEHKGKLDLVTDVDHRSEDAIVEYLRSECPEHGILTEEQAEIAARSGSRWIMDPLDGTTNYAHGYPFFCVSLAFEHNGAVIWGGVYDPLRDELFSARQNAGAWLNDCPLAVSRAGDLESAFLCTGFPYDVHDCDDDNTANFLRFLKKARAVRRDGSAALDLCYVACGRFDGFWEMKLKPWDIAAGWLMVREAGGRVSGFDGTAFHPFRHDIVASNSVIHDSMLELLAAKDKND